MSVLVAGGTGALGTAVVAELLDSGYEVAATWIVERERERMASELGGSVTLVKADLFSPDGAEEAVSAAPGLEGVVNLVGGFSSSPSLHETAPEEFERMLHLNLLPGFLLARAAMPLLMDRGAGAFVAVSARAAVRPFPGAAGYITAKAGVVAFVQALDAEYREHGIRSNCVLPSVIDTPANRKAMPEADHSRWVPPTQIATVIRFLVSDDSLPLSGAAVPVYGRA
ncbi:MAG: SDR family NAD(P)-dependent oxidoreductase [Actinomycetota bacterium]|nr:SDR family NAD(P)-dependent oxidoreductase [Actinomycetota bacterium]